MTRGVIGGIVFAAGVGDAVGQTGDGDGRERHLAGTGEDGFNKDGGIRGGHVFEMEDFVERLAIALLDVFELMLAVDVDEVALFDVSETVGRQEGIESVGKADVVQMGGNIAFDFLGRNDVAFGLKAEEVEGGGDVEVGGVELMFDALPSAATLTTAELRLPESAAGAPRRRVPEPRPRWGQGAPVAA